MPAAPCCACILFWYTINNGGQRAEIRPAARGRPGGMLCLQLPADALFANNELTERCIPPPADATPHKSVLKCSAPLAPLTADIEASLAHQNASPCVERQIDGRNDSYTSVHVSRKLSWHDEHGA